jgi:hypothetical protein
MAKTLVAAGNLASHRAVDNAAIALGDQLDGMDAESVRRRTTELSFELRPVERMALAALLEDITDALTRYPQP